MVLNFQLLTYAHWIRYKQSIKYPLLLGGEPDDDEL